MYIYFFYVYINYVYMYTTCVHVCSMPCSSDFASSKYVIRTLITTTRSSFFVCICLCTQQNTIKQFGFVCQCDLHVEAHHVTINTYFPKLDHLLQKQIPAESDLCFTKLHIALHLAPCLQH